MYCGHRTYSLPETCLKYATVKESSAARDTPVCVRHAREWDVYKSVSNSLEIRVLDAKVLANIGAFLLRYEGTCPGGGGEGEWDVYKSV